MNCGRGETPSPSRRERGKLERRRRVKEAAAAIFAEVGYDAATTRAIAERAYVGTGTVFVFARDKRELLMMVVNDRFDGLSDDALNVVDRSRSLLDQLMDFFTERYRVWALDPDLSRCAVRESLSYVKASDEMGPEILKFMARLPRYSQLIAVHIRQRQKLGLVQRSVEADLVARLVMAVYINELRHWLALHRLDVDDGIEDLRSLLAVALIGIDKSEGSLKRMSASAR